MCVSEGPKPRDRHASRVEDETKKTRMYEVVTEEKQKWQCLRDPISDRPNSLQIRVLAWTQFAPYMS
jgi:hypothetical protein